MLLKRLAKHLGDILAFGISSAEAFSPTYQDPVINLTLPKIDTGNVLMPGRMLSGEKRTGTNEHGYEN